MSKSANALVAVALLSSTLTALASASRVRFGQKQQQQQQQQQKQGRQLEVEGTETVYFSEMMLEGGPSVVVLEAGPFKFETSCVTHEHTYTDSYMSSTTSTRSTSTRETITLRSDEDMSDYNDYSYSYDYPGYDYTEHVAGLRLTYTAPVDDYLYGSPIYANYGEADSDILVGSYSAGDSRTQTVFAGRDGGYGDDSTLQSTSGYYATINGDMTIGIHKENADHLPGGMDAFPKGYDCMIAGFITVVMP